MFTLSHLKNITFGVNGFMLVVTFIALGVTYDYLPLFEIFTLASYMILTVVVVLLVYSLSEDRFNEALYIACALVVVAIIQIVFIILSSGYQRARDVENDARSLYGVLENGNPKGFDDFQIKYECCGLYSMFDYNPYSLPLSCCPGQVACNVLEAFPKGCVQKANEVEMGNANIITSFKVILVLIFSSLPVMFVMMYVHMAFGGS